MSERTPHFPLQLFLLVLGFVALGTGQTATPAPPAAKPTHRASASLPAFASQHVCAPCIRAHMNFLASDALRGRGSGTPDELVAATYIAAQLQQYGIQPAGDDGAYIQKAEFVEEKLRASPTLMFQLTGEGKPTQNIVWMHGKEMLVRFLARPEFQGPLKRVDIDDALARKAAIQPGMVVLLTGRNAEKAREAAGAAFDAGAAAVMMTAPPNFQKNWEERGAKLPAPPKHMAGDTHLAMFGNFGDVILLSEMALTQLRDVPDGTEIALHSEMAPEEKSYTWNAVGKIAGRDPELRATVVLLSAHLDHLGIGAAVHGDDIYNGADDDASGTTAVLELARALALGPRPLRTVIFALFGSEEAGGLGSTWFREHPPVPLNDIAVNLEFEMIGRPDPMYPKDVLWLTGWERSNLGPELAAHGARLEPDKRPEQQFFMRSDNYVLAKKGVVAQTVSSYGLHADYHQPSDDLAHIDFNHMTTAIGSMIRPVEWLLNSNFRPEWKAGGQP